jgi:hypothetical protein
MTRHLECRAVFLCVILTYTCLSYMFINYHMECFFVGNKYLKNLYRRGPQCPLDHRPPAPTADLAMAARTHPRSQPRHLPLPPRTSSSPSSPLCVIHQCASSPRGPRRRPRPRHSMEGRGPRRPRPGRSMEGRNPSRPRPVSPWKVRARSTPPRPRPGHHTDPLCSMPQSKPTTTRLTMEGTHDPQGEGGYSRRLMLPSSSSCSCRPNISEKRNSGGGRDP